MNSILSSHPAAIWEVDNFNHQSPKEAILSTFKSIDDLIGEEVFVPLWTAILKDIPVVDWIAEGPNTYRLVLDSAYQAARENLSGKTWYIEKEIVLELNPDNYQVFFPLVKAKYDNNEKIDANDKCLNAIWAWESNLGSIYTGVGYSVRWDLETGKLITDNLNDAPWFLQALATPRIKALQDSINEWNQLGREKVN